MRGITLTELLIATIVVGIIMLGVASSDFAVRKNTKNQSAGALLTLNTRSIIEHISKNASMATGMKNDQGFYNVTGAAVAAGNFCIRQDIDISGNFLNTSGDYNDDNWKCYTVAANNITTCIKSTANKANACINTDNKYASLGALTTATPSFSSTTDVFSVVIINHDQPSNATTSVSNPGVTLTSQVVPSGHSI